jgi:hypothetical protein
MATVFKHLQPHKAPSWAKILVGLTIAPTMQAIVVDCITVVDPELAPIVGNDTETETA